MTRSVILSSMMLQMKQSFVRPMYQFCLLVSPILNTVLLYEMFRNSGSENFASYVILGAGLMSLWSCICFSSAGDINRERFSGTLSLIFAAPAGFPAIILGKILGNTLLSLASIIISMVTALVLYQAPLDLASPGYFLIALIGMIGSFVAFSSVIACLLTLSRRTSLYMNCIEIPFILLCGMSFPIDVLPSRLQMLSRCLAPTWSVELLRMTIHGIENTMVFFKNFAIMTILSFGMVVFSVWLYKVIDRAVRIHGTLEVC